MKQIAGTQHLAFAPFCAGQRLDLIRSFVDHGMPYP